MLPIIYNIYLYHVLFDIILHNITLIKKEFNILGKNKSLQHNLL